MLYSDHLGQSSEDIAYKASLRNMLLLGLEILVYYQNDYSLFIVTVHV